MDTKLSRRQRILLGAALGALIFTFLALGGATAQGANSQPAFPSTENVARSVAENTAAGANIGAPVEATDADNDALTYTLGGDDAASFSIVPSTGQLQTLAALNFEGKNSYKVTVSASDRKDATGNADTAIDATIKLTISVTDVDDPGAITLSSQAPVVGIDLTASITDPDGGVSSIGWTWSKSSDQTTWTAIAGATSSTYRPVAADVGSYLRATAAYTDSQGSGKNAQQKTDAPVAAASIGVSVSETALTVAEGASATYTVVLDGQPASDVVITVTSNNSDVTATPAKLTFTTANWSTAQTVTVAAADDADAVNDAASITHAVVDGESADEYDAVAVAGVSVTVADDETAGVSVSVTELAVAEGGQAAYTVVLDALPASNVVIGVTASGSPDVTVDRATLTFSPSNWDTAQTVTVSAAQDADAANDAASITHAVDAARSAEEYDNVSIAGVAVTVTDDDTAGVTVSASALSVAEGHSVYYYVSLNTQPSSKVVIAVSSNNTDVTASPATLTFTPSDWRWLRRVRLDAAEDGDALNDMASITHAVVAASSADEYDGVTIAGVAVTVVDDEAAGIRVPVPGVGLYEGDSATYTVFLSARPTSDVVLTVTRSGSPYVTVSPATLTFTTANWSTAQTVTVRAAEDADAVRGRALLTHAVDASRSANEYDGVPNYVLPVTVTDDDNAGVTVSKSTLPLDEGTSATYTVFLSARPTSDVVITVSSDNSDVTVDRATLTFRPSNWDTAQTVTVSAAQDADAANDAASITHAVDASRSAYEYDGVPNYVLPVTVVDDDTAGVTVSKSTLPLDEGTSAAYTVVLDALPVSDVVIGITISGSPDVTVDRATLTFSPSNWDTAQTVTVSAAQDADAVNDVASITHAVVDGESADEYDAVAVAGVAVTVADDAAAGVSVSASALSVAEGGSAAYTVVLDALPSGNVVIGVTISGSPDVTVDRATLTFSPSNWDTAQTVTVSAAQDADAVNDVASITHAVVDGESADEYDAVAVAGVAVTVADDDAAGVSVSASALSVAEGGSAAYTVVLDALPSGNVVIGVTISGSPDVTVDRATLTFSPSNWDTAQTVTVSAAQDADAVNDAASITHAVDASRSADEYDAVAVAGVAVTVADDAAAGVSVSASALSVAEGGSAAYTVVLDALPSGNVVIGVTISGSPDVTVDRATLTFSPSNWDTAQTVTVRAAQDADAVNDVASITHAVVDGESADEYDAVAVAGVAVTVADDAAAGVTVSKTTLTVTEGGSATYTVKLNTQPASDVVIGVTKTGSSDVTVSPATLTFTPSNWDTAQTVTVRAAQDADAASDAAAITHAVVAAQSANEYDAVTIGSVAVTVTDDDTVTIGSVAVSETTLTVAEGGSATYTVRLNTQPASNVVIGVTISGSPDVTVDRATLTFSPSNWDTAQTVTVSAAQDADAVNDAASITHAVDASRSADEYDGVAVGGVSVSVADDDAGVSVSVTELALAEGGQAAYTVVLDALPASDVVITVSSDNSNVTVDRATLTFSPSNWDTAQTVTVRVAQDADAVNDAASITHAVDASRSADEYDAVAVAGASVTVADDASRSADEYDAVAVAGASVTVADDDAGVSVSVTELALAEGGQAAYTVVLDALPASDVVITVSSDNSDVTVDRATLTFTTSNWDTAQTVTVRAAQDADAVNDAASITHAVVAASSADEYDNVSVAGVAVTVADGPFGVTVSATDVTVAEGGSSTYTVWLDRQPSHNTVVRVTASGNGGVSVSPVRLIFTSATWDTPQTVTVSAAEDADAADAAASIAHAVVPLPYNRIIEDADADVSVTVIDDDALGMSLSETVVKVNEGGSSTYTVWLDTLPSGGVVIGVTASGSPDVSVSPARLTFTTANWDTAQTVTVRAAQDADAVNDAAFITHAVVDADSADEYDGVAGAGVSVSVADDDAGVSVSASALSVAEGGSATYTVVLNAQPPPTW